MVRKIFKAIFTKPIAILKSIYFNIFDKHEDLAKLRLEICNRCDQRVNMKFIGDVCGECGCILENKTRMRDEHCDLCKW